MKTHSVSGAEAGDVLDLSKGLVGHGDISDSNGVLGKVSGDGAGAVHDVELSAVLLVGAGSIVVVGGVRAAVLAGLAGDPQVAATGIEDDVELLAGGTDFNLAKVLGVLEVVDEFLVASSEPEQRMAR